MTPALVNGSFAQRDGVKGIGHARAGTLTMQGVKLADYARVQRLDQESGSTVQGAES